MLWCCCCECESVKAAGTMMDQKDMLRLSNSKIKAIQSRSRHLKAEVDELRKNFCRDLALEGAHHEVIGGAVPETFDGSEVVSAADYQVGKDDAIIMPFRLTMHYMHF